ncbi:MAG: hypothetical protein ACKVQK_20285 [Burkholderiales bacterium]
MISLSKFLGVAVLGLGFLSGAQAQSPDVGLVNLLQGDVNYQSDGSQASKAQAFMKVRQGDRFTVPAGAQIRVVYLQGGRQETWRGPSAFRAGTQQSEATNGQPLLVSQLPSAVSQRIQQAPELVQIARLGRSGGVNVRGTDKPPRLTAAQQSEVNAAKATYKTMRTQAAADDIMPEMYLYAVLQDYLLYDDIKPVVEEMAKRQPGNADVDALVAYVKTRTQ